MGGVQAIKRQLLPLIKGSPIVIVIFLVALFIAGKVILYTPNTYQSIARIKLDDQKYGFSNNVLFSDFDIFTTKNKIQAEATVLMSPLLVGMALDSVDFEQSIYRKGKLRNTMLYKDSPILVEHEFMNKELYDKDYFILVNADNTYQLVDENGNYNGFEAQKLGEATLLEGGLIRVSKNEALLANRKLQLEGAYILHVFSKSGLIKDVSSRLDVKEIDKELPIIRVVYKDENPKKVAEFANVLCRTYINDYVVTKSSAAKRTVDFIDKKINDVLKDLQNAELELEEYKDVNGVVNTRQETETGLRQISNLEIQLINLEMNEKAVLELEEYISSGNYFAERAINFGFGDLLMTELVKKLKLWQDERIDLLVKYTPESDEVKAVDQKIEEIKVYIVEAIKRNKSEILTRRAEIEKSLETVSTQFEGLSTREKEMRILEREFHLQEQVYNFLSQKKIEASIASSADFTFHRIIEEAIPAEKPVAPNATLITFVSGLLGLIIGVSFIYLRRFALAKVSDRLDIERHSDLPLIGLIRKDNSSEDFLTLVKSLQLKDKLKQNGILAISSTIGGEGRSFVAQNLANTLSELGMRIALVSMESNQSSLRDFNSLSVDEYLLNGEKAKCMIKLTQAVPTNLDFEQKLFQLKADFDLVVLDTPASAVNVSGIEAMKLADHSLYVIRANKTSIDYLNHADRLVEEYSLKNVMLLLNDAHKASSFAGTYVGSQFRKVAKFKGIIPRFRTYLKLYLR